MFWNSNYESGYTRGGIDVITAVNLFFKFLLLSPVFLLAFYVFATMLKHMIFHGIPSMNQPTEEQIERIKEKDSQLGETPAPVVVPKAPIQQSVPSPAVVRATQEQIDANWEQSRLMDHCVNVWLPRYGNNPNAVKAGSPCFQYQ